MSRSVRNLFVFVLEVQQKHRIFVDLLVLFRCVFRTLRETSSIPNLCSILTTSSREIVYTISDVEKCQEHVRFCTRSSAKSADFSDFWTYWHLFGCIFRPLRETSWIPNLCSILTTSSREIVYTLSDVEKCQEHVRFYTQS